MNLPEKDKQITEQPWLQQAVDELRQPVAPSIAGQLRAARRTALVQESSPKQSWLEKLMLPGWGMAFTAGLGALAIAMMVVLEPQSAPDRPGLQANKSSGGNGNVLLEDLSIMAAQDELQFYQDLELLQWLDEEENLDAQG